MNTRFQNGLLTINFILILFFSICTNSLADSNSMLALTSDSSVLSIVNEQQFWKNWITINDNNTCPLQPFILSYTKKEIKKLDKQIQHVNITDSAILFIQVNIDNGIFYFSSLTWNDTDCFIDLLEWHGPGTKIQKTTLDKIYLKKAPSFNELKKYNVFVDIRDRKHLDRDSMYLTLWHKGHLSRFAAYNPAINNNVATKNEMPIYFLIEMLQTLKQKNP